MTQISTTKQQAKEIDFNAWRIRRKQEQSHQEAVNRQLYEQLHEPNESVN